MQLLEPKTLTLSQRFPSLLIDDVVIKVAGGLQGAVLFFDLVIDELPEGVEAVDVISLQKRGKAGESPGAVALILLFIFCVTEEQVRGKFLI